MSESEGLVATKAPVEPILAPVLVKEIVAPCMKPSMFPVDVTVNTLVFALPTWGVRTFPLLKIMSEVAEPVPVTETVP